MPCERRCVLLHGRRHRGSLGDTIKDQLAFYSRECLDTTLRHVTNLLKLTERQLAARRRELARVEVEEPKTGIVANSEKMKAVLDQVHRVARVDSTVLLTGESGVGKEVLARLIHDESAQAAHSFLAINCAAVPEALIESELFRHVRGAFTGATQDRVGLFEAANRGTLLLDELGDLPAAMQVKLLRVLQEREIRRVGENRIRHVDVRVLAATHRDLAAEVAAGRFRQDLYYRLRVIEIRIPPLRDRPDDVLPMARRFLAETAGRLKLPVTGFDPRAADQLVRWSWPGNLRELQNVIERGIVPCPRQASGTRRSTRGDSPSGLPEGSRRAHPRGCRARAHPPRARRRGRQSDGSGSDAGDGSRDALSKIEGAGTTVSVRPLPQSHNQRSACQPGDQVVCRSAASRVSMMRRAKSMDASRGWLVRWTSSAQRVSST